MIRKFWFKRYIRFTRFNFYIKINFKIELWIILSIFSWTLKYIKLEKSTLPIFPHKFTQRKTYNLVFFIPLNYETSKHLHYYETIKQ